MTSVQTYSPPPNESPAWDAWHGLSAAVVGLALILVLVRLPFLFINTPAQASRINAYFFLSAFIDLLYLSFLLIYIFRHYRQRRSLWLGLAFLLSLASLFLPFAFQYLAGGSITANATPLHIAVQALGVVVMLMLLLQALRGFPVKVLGCILAGIMLFLGTLGLGFSFFNYLSLQVSIMAMLPSLAASAIYLLVDAVILLLICKMDGPLGPAV